MNLGLPPGEYILASPPSGGKEIKNLEMGKRNQKKKGKKEKKGEMKRTREKEEGNWLFP